MIASSPDYRSSQVFLDHMQQENPSGYHRQYSSPTRHFLFWLNLCGINISDVDDSVVIRFQRHCCSCTRYSARELGRSPYISRVRRFVRFLEARGDIVVCPDIQFSSIEVDEFIEYLGSEGHTQGVRSRYRAQAEHFANWVRLSRIRWKDADLGTIEQFVRHDCHCPVRAWRDAPPKTRLRARYQGASRFLEFLRSCGKVPQIETAPFEDSRLSGFRVWLKRDRGATDETVRKYLIELSRWYALLGPDPASLTAAGVRDVVLNQGPERSRRAIQTTAGVLRSYLRFLAATDECRADLVHAVPRVPRPRLATLPRYVSPTVVEQLIEACDLSTASGIRDRAILLLLARLGLRAGDVWRLELSDLDWSSAQIRVGGKNRHCSSLPLPQDVGDAILNYLEQSRPACRERRLFLRVKAPFKPFASSSEIAEIVARAVERSGLQDVPTGAHVFRHSLATEMLRRGANLEAVGAVLRHRSPDATAIYAKVNIPMLEAIAQPWPGDASC